MNKKSCAVILAENVDMKYLHSKLREFLANQFTQLINHFGMENFYFGVEPGAESFVAQVFIDVKKIVEASMFCVLSDETSVNSWKEDDRDIFYNIMSQCDREILLELQSTSGSLQRRNLYMVNQCDYLVCIGSQSKDNIAERGSSSFKSKKTFIVNPITLNIRPNLCLR